MAKKIENEADSVDLDSVDLDVEAIEAPTPDAEHQQADLSECNKQMLESWQNEV